MNRVSSVNDAGVARTYGYDARGNVTSNGKHSFYYDLSDQPTGVSGVGSYVYDGNLKRVKSIQGGKTTYSVYGQGGQLLYTDKVTENKKTDYIRAAGQTIARIENSTVKYPHNDLLGSPVSATTSTGAVEWREQYTPYGEKRLDPTQNKDNVGFTGHVQDDITGLTYMQARYYDPAIGRFLSIDPVGFTPDNPMMFNRYAYANNNPYMYVDPDGRTASFTAFRGVLGIMAADAATADPSDAAAKGKLVIYGPLLVGTAIGGGIHWGLDAVFNESSEGGETPSSPDIKPDEVKDKTPSEIEEIAKEKGLIPKGPNPKGGEGSWVDPQTGKQRLLCHPNCADPHAHVNNPQGERLGPDGEVVPSESPEAHIPIQEE